MERRGTRKGFTLIELLVVIAIIAILAAVLFPVFTRAKDRAKAIRCLSDLKQISSGQMLYQQDWRGFAAHRWHPGNNYTFYWDDMKNYLKNDDIYKCPSYPKADHCMGMSLIWGNHDESYAASMPHKLKGTVLMIEMAGYDEINKCQYPWGTVFLPQNYNQTNPPHMRFSHNGGTMVIYVDGHGGWIKHGKLMYYQMLPPADWAATTGITKDGPIRDNVKCD